jgi:hypothetical protein
MVMEREITYHYELDPDMLDGHIDVCYQQLLLRFVEHILEVEAQGQLMSSCLRFLFVCQAKRSPGCRSHFPITVHERSFKMFIVRPPAADAFTVYGKV